MSRWMSSTSTKRSRSSISKACPASGCSFESRQIVLWYPDDRYVLIAPAIDGDVCGVSGCTENADVRSQDTKTQMTLCRCEDHLQAHERTAWNQPKRTT